MSIGHGIQTIAEIIICAILVVGLFNEERLARFEKKAVKMAKNLFRLAVQKISQKKELA